MIFLVHQKSVVVHAIHKTDVLIGTSLSYKTLIKAWVLQEFKWKIQKNFLDFISETYFISYSMNDYVTMYLYVKPT